jgi:hypothetical protein
MKLIEIPVGKTFMAPDTETKVEKVWIVQRRDAKQIRATRRDGRFAFFAPDLDVTPGPRPHTKRNK